MQNTGIRWAQKTDGVGDDECKGDRRHICYKEEDQGAPCKPPFYNLEKCVRFFPEGGLLNIEDTRFFCSLNGGELPEIAANPETDVGYLTGEHLYT